MFVSLQFKLELKKEDKEKPRDLSPLKPVLVEGAWDRLRSRLAPLEVGGASQ
jgi:hypothetical protein